MSLQCSIFVLPSVAQAKRVCSGVWERWIVIIIRAVIIIMIVMGIFTVLSATQSALQLH